MDFYSSKRQRQEDEGRGNATSLAVGFLIGLSVALTINSHSQGLELQAEAGQCHYGLQRDGTFYQSDRTTSNDLRTACGSLAIAGRFDELRGWRVAYMNLGTIRSRDNHVTQWDEERAQPLPPCDPVTKHGCTAVMHGEGRNYGFLFSLTKRFPMEHFDVIGEAGLFFFRSKFNAWATRDEDGGYSSVSESAGFRKPPAPVLGIGVRKGPFHLMLRHGWSLDHRALSLTDHSFTQLMAGISLPL
jgi:hypothetical protein